MLLKFGLSHSATLLIFRIWCFLVFPVCRANGRLFIQLFRNFCIFECAYISEIIKSQVNISEMVLCIADIAHAWYIALIHPIGMKLESRFRYNRSAIMQNFVDRYPFFKSFAYLKPCNKLSCTSAFIDCETEPFQHIRQNWYSVSRYTFFWISQFSSI